MIVTIVGARPQFVKAAVVSEALRHEEIVEKIIHTGQHYDDKMSRVFWEELSIPAYDINLNVGSGTHGRQTAQMLIAIEDYLLQHEKQVKGVMLYGDTNSTIAGAIAASKLHIPIIHVESGLRSFNRSMPEEINRLVTDQLSHILFCPSKTSVEQLAKEGIVDRVFDVGDVMFDALLKFKDSEKNHAQSSERYVLMTIHRPSNTDNLENLKSILGAVEAFGMKTIWPVHPRTKKVMEQHGVTIPKNLVIMEPLSYLEMLKAIQGSDKVVTDSGGLQKEAYWLKKPCITLREESEWVETFHNNWNILTGHDSFKILKAFNTPVKAGSWVELYGDGKASKKIASLIKQILF